MEENFELCKINAFSTISLHDCCVTEIKISDKHIDFIFEKGVRVDDFETLSKGKAKIEIEAVEND